MDTVARGKLRWGMEEEEEEEEGVGGRIFIELYPNYSSSEVRELRRRV